MLENQEFIDKIQELGVIMGYSAEISTQGVDRYATLRNGLEELHISNNGYGAKANSFGIFCVYPRARNGQQIYAASLSIGLSEKKTAEQISKDIARRLLPEYRAKLQEAIAYNQTVEQAEIKARADIEKLRKEFPQINALYPRSANGAKRSRVYLKNAKIEIGYNGNGGHRLEIDELTTEQLISMLKVAIQ